MHILPILDGGQGVDVAQNGEGWARSLILLELRSPPFAKNHKEARIPLFGVSEVSEEQYQEADGCKGKCKFSRVARLAWS